MLFCGLVRVLSMTIKYYGDPEFNLVLVKLNVFLDHLGANWSWLFYFGLTKLTEKSRIGPGG